MKSQKRGLPAQAGFIQITLVIVGALVILKYAYDIDVVGFLTKGKSREILDQIYNFGLKSWERYNEVIIKCWNYFVDFIKNILDKVKK